MGPRPTQGMKIDPMNCHPDRSEAERRDLLFCGPFGEIVFRQSMVEGPGDAHWQMLFTAFRPQTARETKSHSLSGRQFLL
jgi:hypothetical protein